MRLIDAVGDTLRFIRRDKNMSLREVSKRASVSLGHLSEIEIGKKNASYEVLESIANGLDMSTADLMEEVSVYLRAWEEMDNE